MQVETSPRYPTAEPGPAAHAGAPASRLGRNLAWLLGSRGVSGVLSLGYLAVAARALGPTRFGVFALVLAYAGSIAGLAQFKSWQAVVRYGSLHAAAGRRDRLGRLLGLTAAVDAASAVAGALVAVLAAAVAGRLFGWSADVTRAAGVFGASILLTTGDTASGMLRLSGRFGLLTCTETSASLVRLLGAAATWAAGGGIGTMLVVWGVAAVVESGLEWAFVLRTSDVSVRLGPAAWRCALRENPGIRRFMIDSSASSSLGMLWQQAGTLAVGASAGPAAAGGFRIAAKLAGALAKPADAATRALFPELAVLVAADDPRLLRRVAIRATAIGSGLALIMVTIVATAGGLVLRLVSGRGFASAEPYFVLLAIVASIDLAAIVLEPLLNAHGRSRAVLYSRVVGGVAYLGAIAAFLPLSGPIGAALAAVVGTMILRAGQAMAARRTLAGASRSLRTP